MFKADARCNFTKGVIDPNAHDRIDLEQYRQGLLAASNAYLRPTGGADCRPGWRKLHRHRRRLVPIAVLAAQVSAPNGGTPLAAIDADETTEFRTTNASTGALFVVAEIDLGVANAISCVDLIAVSSSGAAADKVLAIQTKLLAGDAWQALGGAVNLRTSARTRRFVAGAGLVRQARYVRVVLTAGAVGTVGFKRLALWRESAARSRVRRFGFASNDQSRYVVHVTDRNADVTRAGQWVASIPLPHRAEHLDEVTVATSRDVMILFHPDVPPRILLRQGAHDEWDSFQQSFSNVPLINQGLQFATPQDEVQSFVVDGIADGTPFSLDIQALSTAPVVKSVATGTAALAAQIAAVMEALPTVDVGMQVTVTELTATRLAVTLRFAGGNSPRAWPQIFVDVDGAGTTSYETLQDGRPATGALMSLQTGWPRCGAFFQQRLLVGGFRNAPDTLLGSVSTSYFDFDQTVALGPGCGFELTITHKEQPIIRHLFAGRALQIMTNVGEWYIATRALDGTQTIDLTGATSYGTAPGVEQILVEGATLFVQDGAEAVRSFIYSDVEAEYQAESLTLLASHLVPSIVDMAYRRAGSTDQGSQLFLANADGSAAAITILKPEKVVGAAPLTTPGGLVRGVGVDRDRKLYVSVERGADLWLECEEADALLDASVAFSSVTPLASISGLDHLEGRADVWAVVDGDPQGPFTVTGGAIVLARAGRAGEAGLLPEFRLETLPWRHLRQDGSVYIGPARIHAVTVACTRSGAFAVGANGQPPERVELRQLDGGDVDAPALERLVTSEIRVSGIEGKLNRTTAYVTRLEPVPVSIRSLYLEVG